MSELEVPDQYQLFLEVPDQYQLFLLLSAFLTSAGYGILYADMRGAWRTVMAVVS